jgi:hypothetical protein
MKECPKCRQVFAYPNLRFCRFDGSLLVKEISAMHEATTLLFSTSQLNKRATQLDELHRKSKSGKL